MRPAHAAVYRCAALKIGVAKEIKTHEYRVALTPAGARELIQRGHEVSIETGAGDGSSFPDAAYEVVGAKVVSADDVWDGSELLLKVKEPIAPEYKRLREGLVHVPAPAAEERRSQAVIAEPGRLLTHALGVLGAGLVRARVLR